MRSVGERRKLIRRRIMQIRRQLTRLTLGYLRILSTVVENLITISLYKSNELLTKQPCDPLYLFIHDRSFRQMIVDYYIAYSDEIFICSNCWNTVTPAEF